MSRVKFGVLLLSVCILYLTWNSSYDLKENNVKVIVVEKRSGDLKLYDDKGNLVRKYKVALGFSPRGHKTRQGDGKTPEGEYYISSKNPASRFHKSLKISYPSRKDKNISDNYHANIGGDIMIHGIGKNGWVGMLHHYVNWTSGCIAVTNDEIDEIYERVAVGTPIKILP